MSHRIAASPAFLAATVLLVSAAAGTGVPAEPAGSPDPSGHAGRAALASAPEQAGGFAALESQVQEVRLSNGLLILVLERPFAPVFSFATIVDAGASDEPAGKTGIAHMMEHMAFKGSAMVGTTDAQAEAEALARVDQAWEEVLEEKRKAIFHEADSTRLAQARERFQQAQEEADGYVIGNAFTKILEEHGAQGLNAGTSVDQTAYYYSLPANKLELWALMEGNRMTYPVFREFYKEREVVIEERRMGSESSPRGRLREETWYAAYAAHPYRNGVIGFRSDLESFSRIDAEQFFRGHYNAANMVIAVVGAVKAEEVRRVGERYFSRMPAGPKSEPVPTAEPEPMAERMVRTREAAQPLCYVAYYGGPSFTDPDYAAVDALTDILGGGRFSRLYTALVKERKLATSVSCSFGMPGRKYPNLLWFTLAPAPGIAPDSLVAALEQELNAVPSRPVTAQELQGYRNRSRAYFLQSLRSNRGLAFQLAYYQIRAGNWRDLFRELDRIDALTPEEITAQAARIFRRIHRTVGIMETVGREGGGSAR